MNLLYLYLLWILSFQVRHGLRSLDTRLILSFISSLLSLRPRGAGNSRHSRYAIRSRNPGKSGSKNRSLERKKYTQLGWKTTRKHFWCREISYNDNVRNKLNSWKSSLKFPYFHVSTVLIIFSFPHTLFPVGLWHCTIHDFSFLSFRSLLSFHTLDSWRSTAATWPFMTFISFYSHHSIIFTKWPWISFFSSWHQAFPQVHLFSSLSAISVNINLLNLSFSQGFKIMLYIFYGEKFSQCCRLGRFLFDMSWWCSVKWLLTSAFLFLVAWLCSVSLVVRFLPVSPM